MPVRRTLLLRALVGAFALIAMLAPASAFAGAVITPVPTFPYPHVVVGQPFNASITLFNDSTGQEAQAGVTVRGSNLRLFPSCPDSTITANDCPNAESAVFTLAATGTSGAGACPSGTWAITQPSPGQFSFAPPSEIRLQPSETCTVNFTATALRLPRVDSNLSVPGIQTNQVATIDAFSPVTGLTVRNSGTGTTSVVIPAAPPGPGARMKVSEGCPRIVKAVVWGSDIKRVKFFVDGKKLRVVRRAPFKVKIKAFKLRKGRHKVRARVIFTGASGKLAANIKGGFLRCAPKKTPSFTG